MNSSIEIAIKSLGEAMRTEVRAANARAADAEKRLDAVTAGLRALISKLPSPAIDRDAPTVEANKRAPFLSDQVFLKALTYEWTTAGKLWKLLNERGCSVGEGTVYNRMRKLAAEHPDEIEATDKPERWRRKLDTRSPDDANDCDAKIAGKRKRPTAMPRLRLVPTSKAAVVAVEVIGESA